jgi:pilus assembly protein Flp/PilA
MVWRRTKCLADARQEEGVEIMSRLLLRFIREEQAATAVEYAVMLALILLAMIGTIKALGASSGGMWGDNYGKMKAAGF